MVRILLDDLLNDVFVVVVPFCGDEDVVRDKVVRCVRTKKMIGICIFEENPHMETKREEGETSSSNRPTPTSITMSTPAEYNVKYRRI